MFYWVVVVTILLSPCCRDHLLSPCCRYHAVVTLFVQILWW